ncbi:uncharacterized protein LOC141846973 [Curcuma longa]|uniref:uncharacterized protein LOC141846973 n=1 Tax=Curcuma longa TaxID=136217 RepID=UPI003D9EA86F
MNSKLQKQHENMDAYDMVEHLKQLYQGKARHERFEVSKTLFECKMQERTPIETHVLKMIEYVENLERLEFPLEQELTTDLILQSLLEGYSQFIMNYNMNEIDKPLLEILSMLRTTEPNLKKTKLGTVLMVQNGSPKIRVRPKPRARPTLLH